MQRELAVTPRAEDDFDDIHDASTTMFGPRQAARYAELILTAFDVVVAEPFHAMSRSCERALPGVRSFHIKHARKRARGSHIVFYRPTDQQVIIIRVLHERMQSEDHLSEPEV